LVALESPRCRCGLGPRPLSRRNRPPRDDDPVHSLTDGETICPAVHFNLFLGQVNFRPSLRFPHQEADDRNCEARPAREAGRTCARAYVPASRQLSRLANLDTRAPAITTAHSMIRGLSPLRLCSSGRILEPVTNGSPKGRSRRCRSLLVLAGVRTDLVTETVRRRCRGSRRFPVIDGE
jgi:hypothetical protein